MTMFRASIISRTVRRESLHWRERTRTNRIVSTIARGPVSTTFPSFLDATNQVFLTESRRFYNVGTNHPSMAPKTSVNIFERPYKKLMAANRGEIATRINRAASELGVSTVGIYSLEGVCERIFAYVLESASCLIKFCCLNISRPIHAASLQGRPGFPTG